MRALSALVSTAALSALAACASNPQPTQPAPQPARPAATPAPTPMPAAVPPPPAPAPAPAAAADLSGIWDFSVDAGGQVIPGEITLQRSGPSYSGTVSPQGMSPATIRSVTVQGQQIGMVVDTPEGEAVFSLTLSADGRSLTGSVGYQGQQMGFNARRR